MQQLSADNANRELRRILINGRLDQAERIAGLIEQLQGHDSDQLNSDRQSLLWIVDGIQAVLNQDTRQGLIYLEQAATASSADDSLRWVALHWIAKGSASQGQLPQAERSAKESVELAAQISPHAHSLSLLNLAEIAAMMEDFTKALAYLRAAIKVLRNVEDDHGAATALLAMARTLYRVGKEQEGLQTAQNAAQADPGWPDAAVFLSERALAAGDTRQALELLEPFAARSPYPPVVERQRWLIDGVLQRRYDALDVANLLRLRDGLLDEDVLAELRTCQAERPKFYQLHELLAWSLYKLGHIDEAEALFSSLSGQPLDPELRTSVSLGLGCIASGKYTHPASRVKAASGSYPIVTPMLLAGEEVPERPSASAPPQPAPHSPTPASHREDTVPISLKDLPCYPAGGPQQPDDFYDEGLDAPTIETTLGSELLTVPGISMDAAFIGDLQLLAVPDLLDFLQSSRRTGTLIITSKKGTAAVHLLKGRIAGAASPGGVSLGDLLLQRDALTEEGLEQALAHEEQPEEAHEEQLLLGSILLRLGLVERESLEQALVEQVRMALLETIAWTDGRFAFEPTKAEQSAASDEVVVDLDTRAALMDVLRIYDEQNR